MSRLPNRAHVSTPRHLFSFHRSLTLPRLHESLSTSSLFSCVVLFSLYEAFFINPCVWRLRFGLLRTLIIDTPSNVGRCTSTVPSGDGMRWYPENDLKLSVPGNEGPRQCADHAQIHARSSWVHFLRFIDESNSSTRPRPLSYDLYVRLPTSLSVIFEFPASLLTPYLLGKWRARLPRALDAWQLDSPVHTGGGAKLVMSIQ